MSSIDQSSSAADVQAVANDIAGLLADVGVFMLSLSRRVSVACSLAESGATLEDVRQLWEFVRECEMPSETDARRFLAGLLQDPVKRADAFANVRRFMAKKTQEFDPRDFGAAIRRQNQSSVERFNAEWQAYVAAKKAAGQPIAGPRSPHPWERSGPVVVPAEIVALKPDTDAEQDARRTEFRRRMRGAS